MVPFQKQQKCMFLGFTFNKSKQYIGLDVNNKRKLDSRFIITGIHQIKQFFTYRDLQN